MSQQEAWVVHNEEDMQKEQAFLNVLHSIEIPWIEALVLLHYFWRGIPLEEIADLANVTTREVEQAHNDLVGRFGVALGYVSPEEAGVTVNDSEWAKRRRRIRSMYESGFPIEAIRREVKMSFRNVKKELSDMGLM